MATRLYSLYRKNGNRWERKPGAGAYDKGTAIRIFQSDLLSFQGWALRPVPNERQATPLRPSQVLCKECGSGLHSACRKGDCACACRHFNG